MPIKKGGVFHNPFDTWCDQSFGVFLKWSLFTRNNTKLPRNTKELDKTLPVHMLTDDEIGDFCKLDTAEKIRVLWIGHSSCLVNMENTLILVDPVFSERCVDEENERRELFGHLIS